MMKSKLLTFAVVFSFLLTIGFASSVASTFHPSEDTYVDGSNTADTPGSGKDLIIDLNDPKRIYIDFNLSSLSGKTINSAKLYLYLYDSSNSNAFLEVYRLGSSWDENSLNFDSQPIIWYSSNGVDVSRSSDEGTWVEWDLTSDVQSISSELSNNNGWMIKGSDETESKTYKFYSKEEQEGTKILGHILW